MIRKYHNHIPQTTPWHREEEPPNHHETPRRQIRQSNQLSLSHQDDYNTSMDLMQRTTKHRTITDSHNRSHNKQKVNNNRNNALERTTAKATVGLIKASCMKVSNLTKLSVVLRSDLKPDWNRDVLLLE